MNFIATIATAVAAIVLVAFFLKKDCKPALSVFVVATASILLFLYGRLAATEMPWLIGAVLLWIAIAIIVLKTARENGKIVIPLIIIVAMVIAGIAFLAPKVSTETQDNSAKEVTEQTVDTSDPNGEWAQLGMDHANNRFVPSGIDAGTPNEAVAKKAFVAKHDISTLMVYTLQEGLITPEQAANPNFYLTEDKKYLNEEGKAIWNKLDGRLSGAKSYFADKPSGNVNTGTDGTTIYAGNPGEITGDTKTLVSEQPNGTKTETLTRCGNPVFAGSPGLPTGKTDNPTPTPPSPTPDNPVTPKDPSQDPAPQGNAPEGGGTNIDPTAGEYIAPEAMPVVPETPYVAPPPPAAVDPKPIDSEPDDYVPPVPEPEAPTVDDPATGVVPVPGMP